MQKKEGASEQQGKCHSYAKRTRGETGKRCRYVLFPGYQEGPQHPSHKFRLFAYISWGWMCGSYTIYSGGDRTQSSQQPPGLQVHATQRGCDERALRNEKGLSEMAKPCSPAVGPAQRTETRDSTPNRSWQEPLRGRRQCTAGEAAAFGDPQAVLPLPWPGPTCPVPPDRKVIQPWEGSNAVFFFPTEGSLGHSIHQRMESAIYSFVLNLLSIIQMK